MQIGLVQPGTSLGTTFEMIGSLKTVPPKIFLIVPFGDLHIVFKLNSDVFLQILKLENLSTTQ